VADEWVTQLLRQGGFDGIQEVFADELQRKREALQKLNRKANELEKGSDTVRKK
jgi:hypothetical protein